MTTTVKSQSELYEQYKNEVLGLTSEFTDFSEGSMHDIVAGAVSVGGNELAELIISEFSKTFFGLATGTEEQGGSGDVDDIEALAVDHFGDLFARPKSTNSTGEVEFSRPDISNGDVLIAIGTIVKTQKDPNGLEIRFSTTEEVLMTGLNSLVNVEAVDAGSGGNITSSGKITVLESTLSDASILVTNLTNTAGGTDAPQDDEYKEIIKNLIVALAGATEEAVKGAALSVSGVALAQPTTEERVVIDYDIGLAQIKAGATFFRIPLPILYVADGNGNSSAALIQAVVDRIFQTKAAGVNIQVKGAVPVLFNWTASLVLNVSGPNYTELSNDLSKISDSMTDYINTQLAIGQGFNKTDANTHILSIWGSGGTNDLASFNTSIPSGDTAVDINQKLIANNMNIV